MIFTRVLEFSLEYLVSLGAFRMIARVTKVAPPGAKSAIGFLDLIFLTAHSEGYADYLEGTVTVWLFSKTTTRSVSLANSFLCTFTVCVKNDYNVQHNS